MQTYSKNLPFIRNIRIKSNSRSNSRPKLEKVQKNVQIKQEKQHETSSIDSIKYSGILGLIMGSNKQLSKNLVSNKVQQIRSKRRVLTLGKQNRHILNQQQKQIKIPIINTLQQKIRNITTQTRDKSQKKQQLKDDPLVFQENLVISCPDNWIAPKEITEVQPSQTMEYPTDLNQYMLLQSQQSLIPQNCQIAIPKSHWFTFESVTQVVVKPFSLKVDSSAQTYSIQMEDKYYIEYMKHRQLKQHSFQEILNKESKLKTIIRETQQFNKQYEGLMNYLKQGPENDREKRVYGLSVDLEKQQKKIQQAFDKISIVSKEFQKNLECKIITSKKQSKNIFTSIQNLIRVCMKQLQNMKFDSPNFIETVSQSDKVNKVDGIEQFLIKETCFTNPQSDRKRPVNIVLSRILGRVIGQFKFFQSFFFDSDHYGVSVVERYREEASRLKKIYNEWSSLQYENKVLLYNFMKQIQKIPAFTVSLFGYQESSQNFEQCLKDEKAHVQKRFDEFMETKCERCYETRNKIRLMQHNNTQIKPVFKVMEWLIRDSNKSRHSLSLI